MKKYEKFSGISEGSLNRGLPYDPIIQGRKKRQHKKEGRLESSDRWKNRRFFGEKNHAHQPTVDIKIRQNRSVFEEIEMLCLYL